MNAKTFEKYVDMYINIDSLWHALKMAGLIIVLLQQQHFIFYFNMAKEPATFIFFRTTRTPCSRAARLKAGCKIWHLNQYEKGHVVGGILVKDRYPIKILQII